VGGWVLDFVGGRRFWIANQVTQLTRQQQPNQTEKAKGKPKAKAF